MRFFLINNNARAIGFRLLKFNNHRVRQKDTMLFKRFLRAGGKIPVKLRVVELTFSQSIFEDEIILIYLGNFLTSKAVLLKTSQITEERKHTTLVLGQ